MGDEDPGHRLRFDSRFFHEPGQSTQRLHCSGTSRINENGLVAGLEQVGIHPGLYLSALEEGSFRKLVRFLAAQSFEGLGPDLEMAIEKGGADEVANDEALKSRHLSGRDVPVSGGERREGREFEDGASFHVRNLRKGSEERNCHFGFLCLRPSGNGISMLDARCSMLDARTSSFPGLDRTLHTP